MGKSWKIWKVLFPAFAYFFSFQSAPTNVVGMKTPLFRLSRCKEQLPAPVDVSAVRRKFIRLRQEGADEDFQDETSEVKEERARRRQSFETVEEFLLLFQENDKDLEKSLGFDLFGQALLEAMEDGSIFRQPRVNGELSWKRLREQDLERLERLERQQAKEGRKRRGRRRFGHLGKKR
eukprot:symbB.v1.2.009785.t1/scaffold574.1/size185248/10